MDDYRSGTLGLLTLLRTMNLLTPVLVFARRVHSLRNFRVMGFSRLLFQRRGLFSFRESRRARPTSDVAPYKKLADTIFSLSLRESLCASGNQPADEPLESHNS